MGDRPALLELEDVHAGYGEIHVLRGVNLRLEEATMNTCLIAGKLGWNCSARTQIISRFPIVDPPGANGLYVFVEPQPGRVVAGRSTVRRDHATAHPANGQQCRAGAVRPDFELGTESEVAADDRLRVRVGA